MLSLGPQTQLKAKWLKLNRFSRVILRRVTPPPPGQQISFHLAIEAPLHIHMNKPRTLDKLFENIRCEIRDNIKVLAVTSRDMQRSIQLCLDSRGRHFHPIFSQHHFLNIKVWYVNVLFFLFPPVHSFFIKPHVLRLHSSGTPCIHF